MEQFLTAEERGTLLKAARGAIEARLRGERGARGPAAAGELARPHGAFVTLTRQGRLRGCIGFVIAERPLLDTVQEAAQAAAFQDPRFPPLGAQELPEIRLEISVLSETRPVSDPGQIRVGEHGLIVRRGARSGLLLPQVATEYGWDRDTFLAHTCAKAGLPEDSWRDPGTQIELFSAEVFGEPGS